MIKDALGNELHRGDIVAYPTASSSNIYIHFAVIKELLEAGKKLKVISFEGYGERKYVKEKIIFRVDRVILINDAIPEGNEEFKYLLEIQKDIRGKNAS